MDLPGNEHLHASPEQPATTTNLMAAVSEPAIRLSRKILQPSGDKQRRLRRHCEVNYDRFFAQHSPKRSRKSPSPWKMSNLKNILAASKTDKKVEKGIIYSPSQERKWSPKVIQYTIARIYQARLNELSKGSPGSRSKSVPYVKALRFDLFVVNWFKGTYGNTNRSVRMILSTFKL